MGLLDNDGSNIMGLLSPQDRLMSLFGGLTQMGVGMSQPGLTKWQALAQGLGGLGQGMQRGNQQAMQQRLVLQKLMEQEATKKARAEWLKANPQQAGLAAAAGDQFFGEAAKGAFSKDRNQVVGAGSYLVGPDGKPVFQAPAAPKDWQDPEYIKAQQAIRAAGRTNVQLKVDGSPNFGPIPPAHMMQKVGDSWQLVPVPGGPAARDVAKEEGAKNEAQTQRTTAADVVSQDIRRTIDLMDKALLPTTGAGGPVVAKIGGTAAHDVSRLLETVKANTAFDKLAEMRKASPTGAALGNVTEKELALLGAVRGNLDQSQSDEQLRRNLIRLHNVTMDVVHGPGQGPRRMAEPAEAKAAPNPAGATPKVGQTIVNPQTKERRQWDGKAWVAIP